MTHSADYQSPQTGGKQPPVAIVASSHTNPAGDKSITPTESAAAAHPFKGSTTRENLLVFPGQLTADKHNALSQVPEDVHRERMERIWLDRPFVAGPETPIEELRARFLPPDILNNRETVDISQPELLLGYLKNRFETLGMENTWGALEPVIADLLKLPLVTRLKGIRQMTFYHTERGKACDHSRLLHSADAAVLAAHSALSLLHSEQQALFPKDVVDFAIVAFLHDLGHAPFSHATEKACEDMKIDFPLELGCGKRFDHEANTRQLIRETAVTHTLSLHRINAADIIDILQEDHDFHPIQDYADRLSYLLRDFNGVPGISQRLKDDVVRAVADLSSVLVVDPEHFRLAFVAEEGRKVIQKIQSLREVLFQEASVSPESELVNRILSEALVELFNRIDHTEYVYMTDDEVISMFSEQYRHFFRAGGREAVADTALTPVLGFRMEDTLPGEALEELGHGDPSVYESRWRRAVAKKLFEAMAKTEIPVGIAGDMLASMRIIPGNWEKSKTISYFVLGEKSAQSYTTVIPSANRFLAVYLPANQFPKQAYATFGRVLAAAFKERQLIHFAATPCTDRVFGETDPLHYDQNRGTV